MAGEAQPCRSGVCICLLIVGIVLSIERSLKRMYLPLRKRDGWVSLGYFNVRVGTCKSVEMDDVIGLFGEDTCNSSGNRLISFLNEMELAVCNGRNFCD